MDNKFLQVVKMVLFAYWNLRGKSLKNV